MNLVKYLLNLLGLSQPAEDEDDSIEASYGFDEDGNPVKEFTPEPPVKEHAGRGTQLAIARAYNGVKDIAQALENDLQDHGGIPNPVGYITQLKQEAAMSKATVATIVTTEFRVTGVGYHTGKFSHGFDEVAEAKSFARKCYAAAVNASYAATIQVVPYTTRRAV